MEKVKFETALTFEYFKKIIKEASPENDKHSDMFIYQTWQALKQAPCMVCGEDPVSYLGCMVIQNKLTFFNLCEKHPANEENIEIVRATMVAELKSNPTDGAHIIGGNNAIH